MANLLEDTKHILARYGKTLDDILFIKQLNPWNHNIKAGNYKVTTDELIKLLNFSYDDGYGGAEVNEHVFLVGQDFWLERHEYDGSEWWEYKELPIFDPSTVIDLSDIKLKNWEIDND